jgi:hypothetical protein
MLFPLAAMFLYPIIVPAGFMPIKTRKIWNLNQELSGARAVAHVRMMGVTIGGVNRILALFKSNKSAYK